jgi:cAMP phosphodiesterase
MVALRTFLISHSHLDHVLSLVLSAGSLPDPPPLHTSPVKRRRITGTKQVLDDLATMVFSDRIWPNLASWSSDASVPDHLYLYDVVPTHNVSTSAATEKTGFDLDLRTSYHPINARISVLAMPISHGLCRSSHIHAPSGTYTSSAFFIRNTVTHKQFLFFGDVEPDSLALNPSTKDVWRVAASLITSTVPSGTKVLDTIFIECSWPTTRKDAELFGHLNPQHLLQEMKVLASEISRVREAEPPTSPPLSPASQIIHNNIILNGKENPSHINGPIKKSRRRTIIRRLSHPNTTASNFSDASAPTNSNTAVPVSSVDVSEVSDATPLKGQLKGLKLYVMHCKAPMEQVTGIQRGKLSQHIASELRVLVEQEGLGLEVIAVEQGMRICKLFRIFTETPGSFLLSHLRPSSHHVTTLLSGSYGPPDVNTTVSLGHICVYLFLSLSFAHKASHNSRTSTTL